MCFFRFFLIFPTVFKRNWGVERSFPKENFQLPHSEICWSNFFSVFSFRQNSTSTTLNDNNSNNDKATTQMTSYNDNKFSLVLSLCYSYWNCTIKTAVLPCCSFFLIYSLLLSLSLCQLKEIIRQRQKWQSTTTTNVRSLSLSLFLSVLLITIHYWSCCCFFTTSLCLSLTRSLILPLF